MKKNDSVCTLIKSIVISAGLSFVVGATFGTAVTLSAIVFTGNGKLIP